MTRSPAEFLSDQLDGGFMPNSRPAAMKATSRGRSKAIFRSRRHGGLPTLLVGLLVGAVFGFPARVRAETFEFTLTSAGKTSAGVFAADGTLVKTLWSGVPYRAGTYTREWDGTTDNGVLAAKGTYQIRVLTSQAKYTWEGVVGNTSTATSGPTVFHYMSTVNDMVIIEDTAYIATGKEEGFSSQDRFSLSAPGAKTDINHKGASFFKVATDGTKVYWAGADPNVPNDGFVMATVAGTDAQASFANAVTHTMVYGSYFFPAVDYPAIDYVLPPGEANAEPTGLAVQKTHPFLFVARKATDSLHVVDKATGALVHDFTYGAPGDLAVDEDDNLWMIYSNGGGRVVQRFAVAADGSLTAGLTITGLLEPLALASNGTLVVIDGGTSQQVKAFDSGGAPVWTLGQAGGYATDPTVSDTKFDFQPMPDLVNDSTKDPFVAFQSDGSFWVGDTGNYRVQHFSASRAFLGRVSYIPSYYSAAVDANAPARVFANYLEFQVDYDLPLGPENGSWTLVRNWNAGVSPAVDNPYTRMKYVATLGGCSKPGGCTYATVGGRIFELPPGGLLRDTGLTVPGNASLYPDGSIRAVSDDAGVRTWTQRSLTGFDASDNPLWGSESTIASAPVGLLDPIEPVDPNIRRAGVRTSSGITLSFDPAAYDPSTLHRGWHLGGAQGNHWLWKASFSTPITYGGDWPQDGTFDIMNAVGNAGGAVMAIDRHVLYGYRGEGWKGIQTNKFRHYYDDGLLVDEFGATAVEKGNAEAGAELAGNVLNSSLVKLADGRVFLYHNDDNEHGGVHRWRIDDLSTVTEQTIALDWQQDLQPGLRGEFFDSPDWNSANVTGSRLAPIIDFDWGGSTPAGSGLTHGDSFSARWSGYILPQHSEEYTFEVDADDFARLWIGGKQILPGTGTAVLDAGIYTPIRLEYRQGADTDASSVVLRWASASLPSEIVPSTRLASVPAGTDLQAGLPSSGPVGNGTAGWTRSPATDSGEYFHLWAVDGQQNGDDTYLNVAYRETTPGTVETVTRDLGTLDDATARWEVNLMVSYAGSFVNHDPWCGQRMEILDDAGKVVANFYPTMVSYPDDMRIFANGATVVQANESTMQWEIMPAWQPLRIAAENGQVTFEYGGYAPVTASIVDATANWRRAKTFRLYYWTTDSWCGYPSVISIDGLHLTSEKGSGTNDVLDANLPSTGPVTSGTAGWTRDPLSDNTEYFHLWAVDGQQNDAGPYLQVMYRETTPGNVSTVTRDLPMPNATTARWDLGMKVSYGGSFVNHDPWCGQRMEILDDAGKVVANFYPTMVSYPDDMRIYGNGATVVQADESTLQWGIMPAWRPLHIVADNAQVTFKYGDYPAVTTSLVDPTADWRRIKTLRLYYWTTASWCGYASAINIQNVHLETAGTSRAVELLAGLPVASTVTSGEYGWTFAPSLQAGADGMNYWDVSTNRQSWQTSTPVDIGTAYHLVPSGSEATLSRDLGAASSATTRWQLSGLIKYNENPNHGPGAGQYLDVLDDAGKIIARFYPTVDPSPRFLGNNGVIFQGTMGSVQSLMLQWLPFDISAEETADGPKVTFRYGSQPAITRDIFDGTAAWQRAKTMRIEDWTVAAGDAHPRACYLDDLRFTVTR